MKGAGNKSFKKMILLIYKKYHLLGLTFVNPLLELDAFPYLVMGMLEEGGDNGQREGLFTSISVSRRQYLCLLWNEYILHLMTSKFLILQGDNR